MGYPSIAGGGGAGFRLGPVNNLFGTTSGDASASPLTVDPAATKAAAQTVRDDYFTANPTLLAEYDSDPGIGIVIYFISGTDLQTIGQTRTSGEWRDSNSIIALQGQDGNAATVQNLSQRHIGMRVDDELVDSGIEITTNNVVRIPEATLGIGDLLELSEATGFGLIHNNVTGANFILLDHFLSDTTGSGVPRQFFIGASSTRVIQGDTSSTITANPYSSVVTTTISGATFSVTLQTNAAMDNVKMRLVDDATSVPFKHIPSKLAWDDDNVDGFDFRNGSNTLNFFSEDANDPANGLFNLGYSPLELESGRQLRVELKADSVSLLGNSSGILAFSVVAGDGTFRNLAYEADLRHPVDEAQSYPFDEGPNAFNGTVFDVDPSVQEITFSDGTVDIPGVEAGAFHVVGSYLVSQYPQGLVFARVTGSTSSGGAGDIEAVVVDSISFTDGNTFTPPNVATSIRLGVMHVERRPDTSVNYEQAKSGTGQQLGADFSHQAYTDATQVVLNMANANEAAYVVGGFLQPHVHAIGPATGTAADAGVITSLRIDPNNSSNVIVNLNTGITVPAGTSPNGAIERFDAESGKIFHVIPGAGSGASIDGDTLRIDPPPSMGTGDGDLVFSDPAPDEGELLIKGSEDDEVAGSGIPLTSLGRIPFEFIGEGDITLSGTGGSTNINVANVGTRRDRTIFINHSSTFTVNVTSIANLNNANLGPLFFRFVNVTGNIVAVQGPVGNTIGGRQTVRIPENGSLTMILPASGMTDWAVAAAGNPLRRFDILQVTSNQTYGDDAALERICDHLLEVDGTNVELELAPSSINCAFWIHNQGTTDATLTGISGATIEGDGAIHPNDLVWVWNTDTENTYRIVKLGGDEVHSFAVTVATVEQKNYPVTIAIPFDGVITSTALWHPEDNGQVSGDFQVAGSDEFSQSTTNSGSSITPRNLAVELGDSISFDVSSVNSVAGPMTIEVIIRRT